MWKNLQLPLKNGYVLVLRLLMVQYLLHLQRECLAWPEILLVCEPSLEETIHCLPVLDLNTKDLNLQYW